MSTPIIILSSPEQLMHLPNLFRTDNYTYPNKTIILPTESPAISLLISNTKFAYEVGPLEYLAGRLAQLW